MVKLYLKGKKLGVKISGLNFIELKDCLKENGFTFCKDNFCYQTNLWINDVRHSEKAIKELLTYENFEVSDEITDLMKPQLETQLIRNTYKREYLASDPIGDFQIRAIKQGAQQNRLLLAHKMGLGKTFIVISILNHLWHKGILDKILVVAPTESIYNFRREILKFATFPITKDEIYIADVKNRDPFKDKWKVVIVKYRSFLMLSDDAYFKEKKSKSKKYRTPCLPLENWGTNRAIILDESHSIKNMKARQTKALQMHKDFFRFRYLLSGTPYPTGIEDLYSQITFLDPNLIPQDYFSWLATVANLGNRWSPYAIVSYKDEEIKKFLKHIDNWIIREFVEDNIDLPEQYIKNIWVELNEKHKKIYRSFITYVLDTKVHKDGSLAMKEVYLQFPRITVALDNPCLLKGKIDAQKNPKLFKLVEKWKFEDHSKIEACDALLEKYVNEEGKKTILWSGHPLTLNQLAERYKKYNPLVLHGQVEIPKGMSKDEYRDHIVELFKKNKKHKILIANYLVLSSAVNLVEAPRAIYFDRNWNYIYWSQSIKRNHRIGTTEDVYTTPITIENTLEEKLDRVLNKRDYLDKELLNYDSLSKEQWKKIFEGEQLE